MNSKNSKILIVDDVQTNIQIAAMTIKRPEYEIFFADSGAEALELAKTENFDLILLDIMMPNMSGYTVCEKLKEDPKTASVPIIFLTARSDIDSIAKAFEVGGVDYVHKPIQKHELVSRVETQLKLKKHIDYIERTSIERKQLIHMLSHDLANPIGASLAALEMCDEDPELMEYTKTIIKDALRGAMEVISLVRKVRALDDRKFTPELSYINLLEMVDESKNFLEHLWKKKKIEIKVDVDPSIDVLADRTSCVNSVFNNILSNAVKFSFPGTEIKVSAAFITGDRTRIEFEDRGTGYGMPLVEKFVESFGGSIQVVSRDRDNHADHGTTVAVELYGRPEGAP